MRSSSHLRRTACGRSPTRSAAILPASTSATAVSGSLSAMLLIPQPLSDSQSWHAIDRDHDRESDDQHGEAEHRYGAEIARFLEVEDQHRDHLGLGGEQDDGGGELAHDA